MHMTINYHPVMVLQRFLVDGILMEAWLVVVVHVWRLPRHKWWW